jgi:PAB-dependent poly(A)-specific ribonuclease subunit 3
MKDIPNVVHKYHTLVPLDNPTRAPNTNIFGYVTSVYKAISSVDGLPYAIRKIENFRLSNEQALRMADRWKQIQSPNIVGLAEVFISKDFGEVNGMFVA